ncbi:helix-turn-helix transcriptional regulator [Actinopolymorpha singaporensis]|uniref:Regulatory protein, luxR family n=1 Tax=Actinopolymorpha singaporensis TaxID=117157 RepID=A0A1H1WB61_9ACTN|nr:LuxR family transcriptional regulator [Actinopolymorpha singaporensis]SDS94202.1 regulatory protein, luxR family [Actinopolymorpha singaporensis]
MLVGRKAERARIGALLDDARAGASAALVLRGEPGIGKTALLDHAAESAAGLRVLRAAGVESEAELPFAGLHQLLRPVLGRLPALPGPQRRALEGAFGLGTSPAAAGAGDRFLLGAAVLSLLAEAAEDGPLLCLVDDAQWLDPTSAQALEFAARRLDREGVVAVFAVRDHSEVFSRTGLPELPLSGLDDDSALGLLSSVDAALPGAVREELLAQTGGNPLALRELPALLRSARGRPAGPMPLTSRVLDAFHHRIRALPASARAFLLVAAADDTGEVAVVLRAAAELGAGITDLQSVEEHGLVSAAGNILAFGHPLIRAAAYHGAPLAQRLGAHTALAAAYSAHNDADRRAWHLAAAATGPDEAVADALAAAAGRAAARGGHHAAATGYERAARLSADPVAAALRTTLACEAGVHSGQPQWARVRAEHAGPHVDDPSLRARLLEVRAAAAFGQGDLRGAHHLLAEGAALVASRDRARAGWMLMRAVHAAWATPTDLALIAASVDELDTLDLPADDPLTSVFWLARWAMAVPLRRDTAGYPPLDAVLARARSAGAGAGPRALVEVASRAFVLGRDEEVADIAAGLVADARTRGMLSALPAGLGYATLTHALLGRHRDALVSGDEGMRIARDTDQPLWESYTSGALAHLAAVRGDEADCREYAEAAGVRSEPSASQSGARSGAPAGALTGAPVGSLAGLATAQAALALLDLGYGRVQAAFDRLVSLVEGPQGHQNVPVRSVPDLTEAAVRLGRPDDIAGPLATYATWAAAVRRPWSDALLARCRALTTPGPDAERLYLRALDLHDPRQRPFDRARTELSFGEWLRRGRRRSDARGRLASALRTFEEIGARPWAERARVELGAAGHTGHTGDPVSTGAAGDAAVAPSAGPRGSAGDAGVRLTPQELQITELAATGLSNRDIAARLYLSPRTVAYHLYKAYPKLGVSSRGELGRVSDVLATLRTAR